MTALDVRAPALGVGGHDGPAIVLDGVTKTFESGTRALDPVDLQISTGELVLLLGPSGCGKSTIIRMVAGLSEPTAGTVRVLGGAPVDARDAQQIGYVFQEPTLMPWASVRKNVALPLELRHEPKAYIADEVERALALVGLSDRADALPHELSGGMKMRVSIARALVTRPRLLLLDEPFGALDEITRQTLQDELLIIAAAQPDTTVLFVTHNVFEAAYLATRVIVLSGAPGSVVDDIAVGTRRRDDDLRASSEFTGLVARITRGLHAGALRESGR